MAECLSSAAQVRAEHGVASYSTWNYINGQKCWRLGHKRYPRAAAQSRQPRPQSPSTGLPGRTAGLIPATGATDRRKCWMEGKRRDRSNSLISAVASVGSDNLDDAPSRKQAPKSLAYRSRQPIALVGVDNCDAVVGIASYEHCSMDCVQQEPLEVAHLTCDDNCLRLWQAFQDIETMERLVPYRVRAAAKDAAYTAWLNQH